MLEQIQKKFIGYWETLVLSTPKIALSILILCIFTLLAIFASKVLHKRLIHKAENKLAINYLSKLVKFLIVLVGILLALNALGFENIAGGLLAGAGMGAVIIGFAFKDIGENFMAGIILLFDSPFRIGDTVTSSSNMGKVVALNFRTTHLKTFDGKDVYVPNSKIVNSELYNHTQDGLLRHEFVIGIDYDDDIDHATELISSIVNENKEVLQDEKTQILIQDFGTNSVNLKVLFWVNTKDYKIAANLLKTKIMKEVKNALLVNKFGLPANIQEIKMYKPEPIPIILKRDI